MSRKSQMLAMLGLGIAMMQPEQQRALMEYEENANKKSRPVTRPPSGTKEYFFNSFGEFSTTKMLKSECVFICHAINDKNAKRKFTNWQKNN